MTISQPPPHPAAAGGCEFSSFFWSDSPNSECLSNGADHKCATTFNGPLGMGASFNRTS